MFRWTIRCAVSAVYLILGSLVFAQDPAPLSLELSKDVSLPMVWVGPTKFNMGSPPDEAGREADELLHTVELTKGYFIGVTPVTMEQFESFVKQSNYRTEAEIGTSGGFGLVNNELVQKKEFNWRNPGYVTSPKHPVSIVTLDDAKAFCQWLSKKSGYVVTLPTEAQWENAVRAGTQTRTYNGDGELDLDRIAWHKGNTKGAVEVKQKDPNALGLYDMCGNVSQWCLDIYADYPSGKVVDPMSTKPNAGDKARNVLRGGSWNRDARRARSAARYRSDPKSRNADIGFRIVALPKNSNNIVAEVSPQDFNSPANNSILATPPQVPQDAGQQPSQPIPETTLPQDAPDSGDAIRGSLCCLLVVVGLLAGIFFLFHLLRSPGTSNDPVSVKRTDSNTNYQRGLAAGAMMGMIDGRCEPSSDGFWFDTSGVNLGSLVTVQYESDTRSGEYCFEVEHTTRQLLYLGCRPDRIRVVRIDPPSGFSTDQHVPDSPPIMDPPNRYSSSSRSSSSGSSRFPSAY